MRAVMQPLHFYPLLFPCSSAKRVEAIDVSEPSSIFVTILLSYRQGRPYARRSVACDGADSKPGCSTLSNCHFFCS